MTLLGVASGFLTLVTAGLLGNPPMTALVFGVIIGTYLWQIGLATGFRAIAFAILSLLSWMAVARFVPRSVDLAVWQELIIAGGAGLLGAVLLVTSIVVLFPFFRRPRLCLRAILVGCVGGFPFGFFPPLGRALSALSDSAVGRLVMPVTRCRRDARPGRIAPVGSVMAGSICILLRPRLPEPRRRPVFAMNACHRDSALMC